MRSLTFYYSNIPEQLQILNDIEELSKSFGLLFVEICIDHDRTLQKKYGENSPVILVGPYRLNYPFTMSEVEVAARATLYQDEVRAIDVDDKARFVMSGKEKFALWFSKSYSWVIAVIILIFLGFSLLPPLLASAGYDNASKIGYKFYSVLCHQLAFRSYFINGEQIVYPRELANIPNLKTYEEITGKSAEDIRFARNFIGNDQVGYKFALCQRDVAIYLGLGLFGLLFQLSGKKIKKLPWLMWVLIALIPIALDGTSQLPGLAQGWPGWSPLRESTPLFRTITGLLFGIGTAWLVFPMMEDSISETRLALEHKSTITKKFAEHK